MSDSVRIDGWRASTDLYRFYDAEGVLLYVGISLSAVQRAAQHRADKPWWGDVARMEVERHPDRDAALAAERAAIIAERPLHNVVHNGNRPRRVTVCEPVTEADANSLVVDGDAMLGVFLMAPRDGGSTWQGQVVGRSTTGRCLVQWYSWVDGGPTYQELVDEVDMAGWRFYPRHDWWLDAGEQVQAATYQRVRMDEARDAYMAAFGEDRL